MLEELQRRDYSQSTARIYLHIVSDFARYFRRSPDTLGPEHIRQYQVHLFHKKLSPYTIRQHTAALRFFFFKTLHRNFGAEYTPFPKVRTRLPTILSPEELGRLIDSAHNLFHRTLIMTLYSTAMRRAELCRLKVSDIDSQRMMIGIEQGKGGRDREVPLSPTLLKTLRVYWRWMKPKTYLFPSGGMRRTHLRGHQNILKRQLIHVGAFNLSLILRKLMGAGTPREWSNRGGLLP